jgi:hypothetical protein
MNSLHWPIRLKLLPFKSSSHADAVSRGDLQSAEVLLNYRANATKAELQSGMSAMTTAFSKGNAPLAQLLMKYGGDPDVEDGSDRTARSMVKKNGKLADFLDKWDADGAMSFEVSPCFRTVQQHFGTIFRCPCIKTYGLQDSPGTWTRHVHEAHAVPFYYNRGTGQSQFMVPTSCAWHKASVDGHPIYTNYVTHQAVWNRPPALAWKLLHAPGDQSTYVTSLAMQVIHCCKYRPKQECHTALACRHSVLTFALQALISSCSHSSAA